MRVKLKVGDEFVCLLKTKGRKGKTEGDLLMMRAEERGGDFTEGERGSPAKETIHTKQQSHCTKQIAGFNNKRKRELPDIKKNGGAFTHNQLPVNKPFT